jgi:hypothetical protein
MGSNGPRPQCSARLDKMNINWTDLNILDFIFATIVASFLWILDKQKKPKLIVKIGEPSNLNLTQGKFKSLNLILKNKREAGLRSFFNQTATQTKATLIFKDFDSKVELFRLIARWHTTREPLTPSYDKVDPGLALTNPREVITPGEEIGLAVVIKKDKQKNFHPFNNESYMYADYAKPEWEMVDDKVLVTVKIQSAEAESEDFDFVILNKSDLTQFSIANYND